MNEQTGRWTLLSLAVSVPVLLVASWASAAGERLRTGEDAVSEVAVASMSDDAYCSPQLKRVVRRVAGACGLLDAAGGRGCQPMQAKQVASLSGADFNALFSPLSGRAHIVQFDPEAKALDPEAQQLIEKAWANQRGASFFFVVSRASPDGDVAMNAELSRARAQSVLTHLQERFQDPDLQKQVGLLWLGEEFAQLDQTFCDWSRSRSGSCTRADINRSAFVAWIDCAI